MAKGSSFGGKDVKSGGRITQKSAGASPQGKPTNKDVVGRGKEFDVGTAGTVAGGLGKGRSEFHQVTAGSKK